MSSAQIVVQQQVETPKSAIGMYELPCGYLDVDGNLHTDVTVREITGDEEDMLVSNKVSNARKMNELLIRCVERIGPYSDRTKIAQIIPELVVGDRVYLLFAVRRATLGDALPFDEECPKCEKKSTFSIDLSQLEIKNTPDPRQRIFEEVLPKSKKQVKFHPLTGKDEDRLQKVLKTVDAPSASLLLRLEMVGGEPATVQAVKALSLADRQYLRERFEAVEGGVNTTVEVECPDCGHVFERDVAIAEAGFFFPTQIPKS